MPNNFVRAGNLDDDLFIDEEKGKIRSLNVLTGIGSPDDPPSVPEKPWIYCDLTGGSVLAQHLWDPDSEQWILVSGSGSGLMTPVETFSINDEEAVVSDDTRTVVVDGYEDNILYLELPAPGDPNYQVGRVVDFNCSSPGAPGQVAAFWFGDLPALPASLGTADGLFAGGPDPSFDWSTDPETQHWNTGDLVLDADYGDIGTYFTAVIAKLALIGLELDLSNPADPTISTVATGASAELQLVSIERGAVSSGFAATGLVTGEDAQTGVRFGIGSKGLTTQNWDAVLWEPGIIPALPLEDAQGASVIALEDGWYVRNSGRKPNTADRISTHLNSSPEAELNSNPLTGPGLRGFGRDHIEHVASGAEVAARMALGRVVDGDDIDVDTFEIIPGDPWQDSSSSIVKYQVASTSSGTEKPWIIGATTVIARNYTQPHAIFLPDEVDSLMGGSLTVVADATVNPVNSCTVTAAGGEFIDGVGIFEISAPGVYRFERTNDGWTLAFPQLPPEVIFRTSTHAQQMPVAATVVYLDATSQDPWQHFLPTGSDLPDGKVVQVYRVDLTANVCSLEVEGINPETFHSGGTALLLTANVAVQLRWDAVSQVWWANTLWDAFD